MLDRIKQKLLRIRRVFYRPPDFCIGGWENPYIRRWWVIPRNKYFNIYLHNQLRDDDDRALHDHPWWNISIIFRGGYIEHQPRHPDLYPGVDHRVVKLTRRAPCIVFRKATMAHRLQLMNEVPATDWTKVDPAATTAPIRKPQSWSIFITGPRVREWGFWCGDKKKGWRWVHWRSFTDPTDTGKTGKGCDQPTVMPEGIGKPESVDALVQISHKAYMKNSGMYFGDSPDSAGKWWALVQCGDGSYKKIDLEERI